MAKPTSIRLLKKVYSKNILARMEDVERTQTETRMTPIQTEQLSNLSDNLGIVTSGSFVAPAFTATSAEPTDAGFTGAAMGGNGWTFGSDLYHLVLVKNGTLSVGGNTSGNFTAGNGSIIINETGIDIGPGQALLSADGVWGIGGNILLSTTNFDKRLSLTGSGGYSNLSTGANGTVYCVAKDSGGNIYVGGSFTQVGGVTAYRIAKWDGSSWTACGSVNGDVYSIVAVSPTEVYIGGAFTKSIDADPELPGGSVAYNRIAKWNGTTLSAMTGSATGVNGTIYSMAISGSTLTIGGDFTTALGTSAARIAQIDTGTLAVTALGSGLNNTCYGIALSGSDVYCVGQFTGTPAYVGKYSGGSWSTPGSSPPTAVTYAIAISGTDVYIGGNWTGYIKKSSSGGAWATVGAGGPDSAVRSIAIDGTNIIAGYSGSPYVKYYNGSAWSGLGTGLNGIAYALLVDTTWLIGGAYTTANGGTMYRISRYSTSTAPTTLSLQSAMDMLDDHSHYVPLSFHVDSTVGIGVTGYAGVSGSSLYTTAANAATAIPAGTVRSIGVYMSTNMAAGTGQIDITLTKNGANTGLTFSIPQGSTAGVYTSATTTLVTYSVTDRFSVKFVNNASVASGSFRGGYVEFAPS